MHYFEDFTSLKLANSCVTIGSYDGIHLGHQKIINALTQYSKDVKIPSVVVTFYPNPKVFFRQIGGAYYLTPPEYKAALLEEMGVDYVITHPFNQDVANLRAVEFIDRIHEQIYFSKMFIGHDFALGKDRSGDYERLVELGKLNNYSVERINPLEYQGNPVSSSWVRSLLEDGQVSQASVLLGRPHRVHGEVVSGDGRGRQIGIPTANLDVWSRAANLKNGVYACYAEINGQRYKAVTNIGYRPTFDTNDASIHIETHILDFRREIYGEVVGLDFIEYLRGEKKFSGIEELVSQIHSDIDQAQEILG